MTATTPEAEQERILTKLSEVGRAIHAHTTERDSLAEQRRDLYVAGEDAGLSHRQMAEAQGVTEGAVTLALRKIPGRLESQHGAGRHRRRVAGCPLCALGVDHEAEGD